MTTVREATLNQAMTRVVLHLEHALDLLLADETPTPSAALLAVDLHEIVVTVHEAGAVMVDVVKPELRHSPEDAAQAALDEMSDIPPEQRPLWLLGLHAELSTTLRGMR